MRLNKIFKKSLINTMSVLMVMGASLTANAAYASDIVSKRVVSEKLQSVVPFKVVEVNDHVTGLYEIVSDKGVFYSTKDGKHLFSGAIHEFKTGLPNLTELKKQQMGSKLISQLEPTFITYKAPREQFEIIAFFDSSCGFCRKMHNEISRYTAMGITVHYALYPRSGLTDPSGRPAQSAIDLGNVACASNPNLAMNTLMQSGQSTPAKCQSPVSAHYELGQWLGVQGTPMIFNMQGQLVMNGYAPANAMLQALETGNYNQR